MGWRKWVAAGLEIGASMLPGMLSKGATKGAEVITRAPQAEEQQQKSEFPLCAVPGGKCITGECVMKCKYR